MIKGDIRLRTCRRRASPNQIHAHRSQNGKALWSQTFKVGYVEQAFKRASVRTELLHGPENAAYLLRQDHRLLGTGKAATKKAVAGTSTEAMSVKEGVEAPWVWSEEAALAVWS